MKFTVIWEIEIDADSAKEAAKLARSFQLDPQSMAVVFGVTDENGILTHVDLLDCKPKKPGK